MTDGAVLAIGLAGRRTGRLNCLVNDLGVSLGGDHFLRNEDFVADGAVLAFRLARLRAGRPDCRINHFRVTSLCKLSLFRCCASITGARFLARCCAACGSCYCPFAPAVA